MKYHQKRIVFYPKSAPKRLIFGKKMVNLTSKIHHFWRLFDRFWYFLP